MCKRRGSKPITVGTTVANLGMKETVFPRPVFHGDTIRVETTVLSVRDSRSKPDRGIVEFEHRAYNQHDDLVAIHLCRGIGLDEIDQTCGVGEFVVVELHCGTLWSGVQPANACSFAHRLDPHDHQKGVHILWQRAKAVDQFSGKPLKLQLGAER